jgi:hypothetical protein
MVNMMRQQETADRQAAATNEQLEIARAREAHDAAMRPVLTDQARATLAATKGREERDAAMHAAELSEANIKARQAEIKLGMDFLNLTTEKLKRARNRNAAIGVGAELTQQFPMFKDAIDQTLATLPDNDADYEPWRRQTLFESEDGGEQLRQRYIEQKTGDQTRLLAVPELSADPNAIRAVEVPGSRRQIQPTPKLPPVVRGSSQPRATKSQQGQSSPPGPWDAYKR